VDRHVASCIASLRGWASGSLTQTFSGVVAKPSILVELKLASIPRAGLMKCKLNHGWQKHRASA
jgi:hypothetical protein